MAKTTAKSKGGVGAAEGGDPNFRKRVIAHRGKPRRFTNRFHGEGKATRKKEMYVSRHWKKVFSREAKGGKEGTMDLKSSKIRRTRRQWS